MNRNRRQLGIIAVLFGSGGGVWAQFRVPEATQAAAPVPALQQIEQFIDHCPANDPSISIILNDLKIRRDGVLVTSFPCAEPFTATQLTQFSVDTFVLQVLRVMYYLDQGRSNYLPWTPLRLYDWVKSKIGGVNLHSESSGSFCCDQFDGFPYVAYPAAPLDDGNKAFRLSLRGMLANVALLGHETRHVDGYPHVSCCGIPNGCDQSYNEANLTPYGIQFYLEREWLTGDVNLNIACLDPGQWPGVAWEWRGNGAFDISDANIYLDRFCDVKPSPLPDDTVLGGACIPGPYPWISPNGICDAGDISTDAVSSGGLISIFGPNLASGSAQAVQTPLPWSLANTSVEVNDQRAPLLYVGSMQINAQMPYEIPPSEPYTAGQAVVVVTSDAHRGFRRIVNVKPAVPAFFISAGHRASAQNQDGSLNGPTPVKAGSAVTVYFTGQGQSDNPVPTGAAAPLTPLSHPIASGAFLIDGHPQTIQFIGLTPLFVGVSQVNVLIDPNLPAGDHQVILKLGNSQSLPALLSVRE